MVFDEHDNLFRRKIGHVAAPHAAGSSTSVHVHILTSCDSCSLNLANYSIKYVYVN